MAQCDSGLHLGAHAALLCSDAQGPEPVVLHGVVGGCSVGFQEVQARCCYADLPPAVVDLGASGGPDVRRLQVDEALTVATLRSLALDDSESLSLGEWTVQYAPRSELATLIDYRCGGASGDGGEFLMASFEPGATNPRDSDPGLKDWQSSLQPARGISTQGLHWVGEDRTGAEVATQWHIPYIGTGGFTALSFWARSVTGPERLQVELGDGNGEGPWPVATVHLSGAWQRFEISFRGMLAAAALDGPGHRALENPTHIKPSYSPSPIRVDTTCVSTTSVWCARMASAAYSHQYFRVMI